MLVQQLFMSHAYDDYLEVFNTNALGSFVVMVQLNISVVVVAVRSCTCDKTSSFHLHASTEAPE